MIRPIRGLFTLFLLTFFCSLVALGAGSQGKLMVVKGDVKIVRAGKEILAKVGMDVLEKDVIKTGKDARAKLVMKDKNELNVAPETQLSLDQYVYKPEQNEKKVLLNVMYGKVRSSVNTKYDDDKNTFRVKTPSAVAGVRGTDFSTSFNQSTNQSKVVTFQGQVAVGSPGPGGSIANPVLVNPGQMTSVAAGQPPAPPSTAPPSELKQMKVDAVKDSGPASNEPSGEKPKGPNEGNDKANSEGDKSANDNSSGKNENGAPDNKTEAKQDAKPEPKQEGRSESKQDSVSNESGARGEQQTGPANNDNISDGPAKPAGRERGGNQLGGGPGSADGHSAGPGNNSGTAADGPKNAGSTAGPGDPNSSANSGPGGPARPAMGSGPTASPGGAEPGRGPSSVGMGPSGPTGPAASGPMNQAPGGMGPGPGAGPGGPMPSPGGMPAMGGPSPGGPTGMMGPMGPPMPTSAMPGGSMPGGSMPPMMSTPMISTIGTLPTQNAGLQVINQISSGTFLPPNLQQIVSGNLPGTGAGTTNLTIKINLGP